MTSATGIKADKDRDQEAPDRRRGMKLVPCQRTGKRFRIEIADGLLDPLDRTESQSSRKKLGDMDAQPDTDDREKDPKVGGESIVLATAAIAGLILGYILGRRS